jgi:hypothetical protein
LWWWWRRRVAQEGGEGAFFASSSSILLKIFLLLREEEAVRDFESIAQFGQLSGDFVCVIGHELQYRLEWRDGGALDGGQEHLGDGAGALVVALLIGEEALAKIGEHVALSNKEDIVGLNVHVIETAEAHIVKGKEKLFGQIGPFRGSKNVPIAKLWPLIQCAVAPFTKEHGVRDTTHFAMHDAVKVLMARMRSHASHFGMNVGDLIEAQKILAFFCLLAMMIREGLKEALGVAQLVSEN